VYRPIPVDPRERSYAHLPDQGRSSIRQNRPQMVNDLVIPSRDDAEKVVEQLIEIVSQYDVASLADYYALIGLPGSHLDNKFGWSYLNNVQIRQVHEGFVIDLPPLEEI
jgi:hypothetical protein